MTDYTENELKPCPFCKTSAVLGGFMIGCPTCKVSFKFDPRIKGSMNNAAKLWNKRVADN
jgi:hypothetical protein